MGGELAATTNGTLTLELPPVKAKLRRSEMQGGGDQEIALRKSISCIHVFYTSS